MEHNSLLEEQVDLQPYNTFGVRSTARFLVRIHTPSEVQEQIHSALFKQQRHLLLGGGSNLLFINSVFNGIVLKNEIDGIETISQNDVHVILKIGGGIIWNSLVTYCIDHDFGGLENLSLIPGTVGAAPIRNIGAYGAQVSDVLHEVVTIELSTGREQVFPNAACKFGYRDSIFNKNGQKHFIIAVVLRLTKSPHHQLNTGYGSIQQVLSDQGIVTPAIRSVSEAVSFIRRNRLPNPNEIGNAGSFFINPHVDCSTYSCINKKHPIPSSFSFTGGIVVIPTAWLIEKFKWKGRIIDHVGVYSKNAAVLVNYGERKGREIWELATRIRQDTFDYFGIYLVPEVYIIN